MYTNFVSRQKGNDFLILERLRYVNHNQEKYTGVMHGHSYDQYPHAGLYTLTRMSLGWVNPAYTSHGFALDIRSNSCEQIGYKVRIYPAVETTASKMRYLNLSMCICRVLI